MGNLTYNVSFKRTLKSSFFRTEKYTTFAEKELWQILQRK